MPICLHNGEKVGAVVLGMNCLALDHRTQKTLTKAEPDSMHNVSEITVAGAIVSCRLSSQNVSKQYTSQRNGT